MSLLNQVLQDLDDRAPLGEGQPIRLSVAPAVERIVDTEKDGDRSDRLRLLIGLAVVAAFAAAVWAFYPAGRISVEKRVPDPPLAMPAVPAAQRVAPENPVVPVTPEDSADHDAGQETQASLPPHSSPVEKEMSRETAGASVPRPAAAAPVPMQTVLLEAAPQRGEPDKVLPASTAEPAPTDYLPLRNTGLPLVDTPRPRTNSGKLATGVKVKTASLPEPQSLQEIRHEIDLGELSYAEYLLQQRLREVSGDRQARELLIGLMLRGERYATALQQLDQGLSRDPGHIKFVLIKARLLAQSGETAKAIQILESAPSSQTGRPERLQMLGALYQQQSRYQAAEKTYRTLLDLTPSAGPAWVGLAISLDGMGDPAAREAYARALRLGGLPATADAYARQRVGQLESEID